MTFDTRLPPSGAFPEPREGLPPCIRGLVVFEGWQACWHDMKRCPVPSPSKRHLITAGARAGIERDGDCTNGAVRNVGLPWGPTVSTEGETEAKAAWERAEDWLRTRPPREPQELQR